MFMAMTEDRPYRKGLPVLEAVAELSRVAGSQLDPICVKEFLALLAADGVIQEEAAGDGSKRALAN